MEPEPGALHRSIGPELGEVFADLHRSHGVEFRFGEGLAELRGSGGRVTSVVTSADAELPADLVIIGIGAVPNDAIAAAAGLEVDNGILVDEALRSSDPDIFAAGDVANCVQSAARPPDPGRALGQCAGRRPGRGPVHARPAGLLRLVPYFFSDQYDLGMEAAGVPEPGPYDQVVYRGDPETLEFIAFWLSDGAVVAGMNVNVWDVNDDIQALIRAGTSVDVSRLEDPDVPLTDL